MARQVAGRLNPLTIVETVPSKPGKSKGETVVMQSAEIAAAASLTHPAHFTPSNLSAVVAEVPQVAAPGVEFPAIEIVPADLQASIPVATIEIEAGTTPRPLQTGKPAIKPFASTMETVMTTAEDFMAFGQGNLEAFVKSGQIWAAGIQDLGKHVAATAQTQFDQTMTTWKAMAGVKSVKEALDVQTGIARAAVEAAVSETGKLTDASMKLSEQTIAPITARVSLAVEKFGRVSA